MKNDTNSLIIIVEDSPEDYDTTIRAFKKVGMNNKVIRFEMGDECLDYLFGRGKFEGEKILFPGLILLDLNLPGIDGREVLKIIKSDLNLKKIPVVVLTTSNDIRDIEKCYQLGANSYIQKPVGFEGFINAIIKLKEYWFEISILPKAP
ncbi:response regulator [Desulfosporosinus sp. BICA1-9]|uniref:response regulator n=1 Tax=Desulfosporosinus sp. BICA1-9 TaxID=1531958 RepID=UPI00054C102E|nr:response regulator [Desulfosporosinus sp. BICA1-9]KJS48312.1 MAG: chemotaxis protein CheY [Peptococcaceae bacterium BRH_c23]KJS90608.1 MAG: chemotaxis protein CheY [Desulfosporosinus sp. BICA1-9]HBW36843.1 response regulator [Desulfosporosinus sp.]